MLFGVYLLTPQKPSSGPSKHMKHTYIGFTVSPKRRLRQHNGDIVNGAKKTCKYRPWDMLVVVYGFMSKVQALQFEYVWQHPYNSRFTKPMMKDLKANKAFGGIRSVKRKLLELYSIVNIAPWSELALTISFTTRETLDLAKSVALLEAPACMQIQIASLDTLPAGKESENDDSCSICYESIAEAETRLRCYHGECSLQSHVDCINECFPDESINGIPSNGYCPLCDKQLEWSILIRYANREQITEHNPLQTLPSQETQDASAFELPIPIDTSIIDLTNDD
ncbi:hypothetical protein THRCLA_11608 [Thraustotheca clavata]|uniref:Structure-specific endonuclease subunit SLX1 homolog n=1 Tax=Thraustotheca clavata TaxID=74557 RepID=A0A1V9Y773_9STRA|nr:hypothetical protein THRCLA_11608 [Thraustotheca clavata]